PNLAASTNSLYRYLLRNHVLPCFDLASLGEITSVAVQRWLADLHATKLSPNTVAKAYRLLRVILDAAVDAGLIPRNPCTIKGAGTERTKEMQIATPEQVAALAEAVGPRWEAVVFTAAYGGLRWGELAGLRRCDVDLVAGTVRVARKLGEVEGQLAYGAPKSAAGRRTLGIPSFVARALELHMALYAEPGPEGLVFPAPRGGPMRRANFRRRVWVPARETVGVPELRFHDLRHTAATLAAASGTSLKALMARIGHSSAAAALRYQHVIDGQDADIVRFLERFDHAPQVPVEAADLPPVTATGGHVEGTTLAEATTSAEANAADQQEQGGGDGARTHDFLLAKQLLRPIRTRALQRNRRSAGLLRVV
ncbi:MAG: site-specific integrase, partial [Actinomycetota bacterium]|nr:site-specific integrase [Actinomycetota bacterium]